MWMIDIIASTSNRLQSTTVFNNNNTNDLLIYIAPNHNFLWFTFYLCRTKGKRFKNSYMCMLIDDKENLMWVPFFLANMVYLSS